MTNLGLDIINESDYVSPKIINDNFAKLDALGVDYVVEQGTAGEWHYTKWNSGRAECTIADHNCGLLKMTWKLPDGSYRSPDIQLPAFPFNFVQHPFESYTFNGDSLSAYRGSYISTVATASTSLPARIFIVDWLPNDMNANVGCYIIGRWK